MSAVDLAGVTFAYGATPVLTGVDLAIASGELFLLLGPSGCGKTTILRLIAGFLNPVVGTLRIAGQDQAGIATERRGLGMVFQHYALWPHLTVAGNVAFPLEVAGIPATERASRVDEALQQVALPGYGPRRVSELSGGQQQRVALARAIVARPRVLLLDEPLSNLDARLRTELRSEIRRVCKAAGVTGIYVTHDQAEALAVADRIALVLDGRVAQVGAPRELYERPASRAAAAFLGDANLLPATWMGDHAVCALGQIPAQPMSPLPQGATCTVMVRPERLHADPSGCVGTIVSGDYHGTSATWQVDLGAASIRWSETPPRLRQPGEQVRLAVDAGAAVALAD
jgi:ABC-type Fe3+/spermidine/putrescine transport system ATPase subunit